MSMRQSIEELAKSVNLPNKNTKHVIEYLKHDILLSLYRKNPRQPLEAFERQLSVLEDTLNAKYTIDGLSSNDISEKVKAEVAEAKKVMQQKEDYIEAVKKVMHNESMNKKVAETYKKNYSKEFDPKVFAKNKNLSLFLMGPPGQGKTASYLVAAKEVCADLNLRFVDHVSDDYEPQLNDFVMVVQECAGENSAIVFGGIPKAEEIMVDGKKVSVLKKAINYRFSVFDRCAGGVLLFDDAANAAQVIQNVLLPVAQFGSFQGTKINNACIGFTGNLGSLDGTYTTELSSALRTRVIPLYVTDTIEDFAYRAYENYNDSLGDLGMINFLKRNSKDFSVLPDPSEKSGFACPRSWDNLIQSIRSVVERNGGRGRGESKSLEEIQQLGYSIVGPELGQKISAYYNSMIRGADPLARKFIIDNNQDIKELESKYSGGASQHDISFGFQFATACGDYAVNYIAESKNPQEALSEGITRFAKATLNLNDSEFSFAIEHLKSKLASYVPDFTQSATNGKELHPQIRKKIAHIINDLPECSQSKTDVLIKVITDFDKISPSNNVSRKPKGKIN